MNIILSFIWPHVALPNKGKDENLNVDIEKISQTSWGKNPSPLLDEARRLRDIETNRKNSADVKSQIYFSALLSIVPILISLTSKDGILGNINHYTWNGIICLWLLFLGILYGIGAFVNCFRVLNVRAYNRFDIEDFISIQKNSNYEEYLLKEILKSVRFDRPIVNHKSQ